MQVILRYFFEDLSMLIA